MSTRSTPWSSKVLLELMPAPMRVPMLKPPASGAEKLVRLSTGLVGLVSISFPLLVLLVSDWLGTWPVIALLAVAVALRFSLARTGAGIDRMVAAQAGAVAVVVAIGWFDGGLSARLYPVAVNATLLIVFAASLFEPPTVIERLARITEPELPENAIRYCRNVTKVWCGFFLVNGLIASWTVYHADAVTWAVYNGMIAYIAAGLIFAVEVAFRRRMRRRAGER